MHSKLQFLIILLTIFLTTLKKLLAKTVDDDPAGCQRWISRKEI